MIPKIAHCIFGLRSDFGGIPFSFIHWAAIKSFRKHHPDFTIYFWYHHLPTGGYFEDCVDDIVPQSIVPPTEIFGRELKHLAHQADVLRLELLIEHGGLYFDLDTLTVRSVGPLLDNAFVLGRQRHFGILRGLCNAIMLSEKNSPFGAHWLNSYKSFRSRGHDSFWDEHSVRVPFEIARRHPSLITIVPREYFFNPDWTFAGISAMFLQVREFPGAFIHHLWESAAWGVISKLDEHHYVNHDSSYARLVRAHLAKELGRLPNGRSVLD